MSFGDPGCFSYGDSGTPTFYDNFGLEVYVGLTSNDSRNFYYYGSGFNNGYGLGVIDNHIV